MKLINCHIENFGKISGLDLDFTSGLNQILEENGWGKSTLAAFIATMFYGLDGTKKTKIRENERKFYQPWNNGCFGGSLTFEANAKRYMVTRTFGKKESEDTFILEDAIKNLPSDDFSENIGIELFGVDRESFLRTVFVRQQDAEYSGTTAKISAKIGDLSDTADDMSNFDKADETLKNYINSNSPKKVTGNLYKLKREIDELRQEIREEHVHEIKIQELKKEKDAAIRRKNEITKKHSELYQTQKVLIALRNRQDKQKQLSSLIEEENKRRESADIIRKNFGKKVPTDKEIKEISDENRELQKNITKMEHYRLTEEESTRLVEVCNIFGEDIPDAIPVTEAFEKARKLWTEESEFKMSVEERDELELLLERFRVGIPSDEEIDDKIKAVSKIKEKQAELAVLEKNLDVSKSEKNATDEKIKRLEETVKKKYEKKKEFENKRTEARDIAKSKQKKKQLIGITFVIIGIISVVTGIILRTNGNFIWIAFGAALAAEIAGIALVFAGNNETDKIYENEDIIDDSHNEAAELAAEKNMMQKADADIQRINSELGRQKDAIKIDIQKVSDFLAIFGIEYDTRTVESELYDIRHDIKRYDKLQEKRRIEVEQDKSKEINEKIEVVRNELKKYYKEWDIPMTEMESAMKKYIKDADDVSKLTQKKSEFDIYEKNAKNLRSKIEIFFTNTVPEEEIDEVKANSDFSYVVDDMTENLIQYENACKEEEISTNARVKYADENPEITLKGESVGEKSEDDFDQNVIDNQIKALSDELDHVRDIISQYDRDIDDACEKLDEIADTKERAEELETEYKNKLHHFELVEMTRSYLTDAKERFTAKFMKPIMDGYGKYYQMIVGKGVDDFRIDANANLTKKEEGSYHEIVSMSGGYKDLIGICMRMALIDEMYTNEKPVIIFDDPFVNLDEEKTVGAMKLLREIAKEYQVVYFVCHESRKA